MCAALISTILSFHCSCRNESMMTMRPECADSTWAINYVIYDFLKTPLAKDNKVIGASLIIEDSLDIHAIVVVPYYDDEEKWPIGLLQKYKGTYCKGGIPTAYMEKSGKLFLWNNENIPLTQDMIDVLIRYNRTITDYEPWELIIDDGKQVVYYFCKSNYRKHTKRFRRRIWENVPCLRCK